MQGAVRQRGASLIEVMMAALIFSIGLIGLAGLMIMAARSSHAAYVRTQVTFLAESMASRMSANPSGVWDGSYNGSLSKVSAISPECSLDTPCDASALAKHDLASWSVELETFLPAPRASIQCQGVSEAVYGAMDRTGLRPPYGGTCEMTISWLEQGLGDESHRSSRTSTFAWRFQP